MWTGGNCTVQQIHESDSFCIFYQLSSINLAPSSAELTVLMFWLLWHSKVYWVRLLIVMGSNLCLHCDEQLLPFKLEIKVEESRYLQVGDRTEYAQLCFLLCFLLMLPQGLYLHGF